MISLFRINFKKLVKTTIFLLSFFYSTIFATEREDIVNSAAEYANHNWSCTEYNVNWEEYATYGCSEHQQCDYTPGSYTGVAYGYGFDDTIDDYYYYLAYPCYCGPGCHKCHYDNYYAIFGVLPDWVTGIDCSGLVCNCWQISRIGTYGLSTAGYSINNQNIEKGDILVKAGSHVVIVDYLSWGMVYFYEATGDATTEFPFPNVRYTNRTLQSFTDNGYTARSKFIPSTGIEPGEGEIFTYSPTALVATTGANQISLNWTASSGYVDGYYIYRGTQSNREYLYADVGNVTNYTDTDVINGYTYYYKVSAYTTDPFVMTSYYSNEASATLPSELILENEVMSWFSGNMTKCNFS